MIIIISRGLGIGDWAIPNPQSPIPKTFDLKFKYYFKHKLT